MTNYLHMASGRLTFQPTPRNKITAYLDKSFKGQKESTTFTLGAPNPAGVEWETATTTYKPGNYQIGYLKWSSPLTNRILLEVATGLHQLQWSGKERPGYDRNLIQVNDRGGAIPATVPAGSLHGSWWRERR